MRQSKTYTQKYPLKKISPQSSSFLGKQTHLHQPLCVHLILQQLDSLDGLSLDNLQCIHVSRVLGSRALVSHQC